LFMGATFSAAGFFAANFFAENFFVGELVSSTIERCSFAQILVRTPSN